MKWSWAMAVWLSLASVCVQAAQVEGVRLWRSPDSTRIVLDLSAPVEHTRFALQTPERLVVDIKQARLNADLSDLALADTPVAQVRFGKRGSADLRLVLDLKAKVESNSFVLARHGDKPHRLVIDLLDIEAKAKTPSDVVKVQELSDMVPDKRDIVIAVDAGHGGEDPGAIGPHRLREKDVVLSISKKLVNLINQEPGYQAFLVRTGDYYIPLRERRNRAREMRADLLVSVHADAFKDSRAHGASVFALSRSGATSETARFLATKENEADLIGGVGGVDLRDVDDVVAGVLVDLSMTATLNNSLDVGARVLSEMGSMTRLHKKQVEQAGFAVLKSPDVPSILVETGFISNPSEAKNLGSEAHRARLAEAIFRGVRGYFNDAPPAGSWLAWQKANRGSTVAYTIARGDTLSAIAQRHKVSLRALLEHNGLKSSSIIKVGQRLEIPAT